MHTDNHHGLSSIYFYNNQYSSASSYEMNETSNIPETLTKLIESDQAYRVRDRERETLAIRIFHFSF